MRPPADGWPKQSPLGCWMHSRTAPPQRVRWCQPPSHPRTRTRRLGSPPRLSAPRGQPLRSPARSRTANGKGHRDAAALSRPRTYRNPLAQSSSPVGDHLAVLECRASIPRARLPAGSPGGLTGLKVEANNFRRMVLEFECRYPGLGRQIEESMLVAIDGEIFQDAYFAPLKPDREIYLIPKIGGG